jgi:hypothetical protein
VVVAALRQRRIEKRKQRAKNKNRPAQTGRFLFGNPGEIHPVVKIFLDSARHRGTKTRLAARHDVNKAAVCGCVRSVWSKASLGGARSLRVRGDDQRHNLFVALRNNSNSGVSARKSARSLGLVRCDPRVHGDFNAK